MRSTNKKFISALACASAMTALAIIDPVGVTKTHQVAQAATDTVPAKSAGVDVSSWQGKDLTQQAKSGAQFAVVKVSEGTNYQNPRAQSQVNSAEQNNMMPMGYHYTHFGDNSNQAVQEGNYAVNSAKSAGLQQGSYLAADWEQDPNNKTTGSIEDNTSAITSFMDTVHNGGYNPMLYSSESLLKNKVDTNKITEKYPNSLWVAKYKTNGREDNPDYNYFPSMDNVAIWQYTQNWRGQNVDGNVNVVPLSNKGNGASQNSSSNASTSTNTSNVNTSSQSSSQAPANPFINDNKTVDTSWVKQEGTFTTGGAINLRTGASTNSSVIAQLPANTEVKYDAYSTKGNYTWLRQPRANNQYGYLVGRANGQDWGTFKTNSVANEVTKPATNNNNVDKPAENTNKPAQNTAKPSQPVHNNTNTNVNSDWTKQNGVFVTGGEINLRTGASTNSSVIAQLPANTEVKYDAYRTEGQYTWLRQPRANGQYGYLVGRNNGNAWGTFKEGSAEASKLATNNKPAQNNNKPSQPVHNNTNTNVNSDWTKQNGVFVTGGEINLRTGASTNSSVIAQLPANTEVKYDAYRTEGQYTWLRQPRANGQYGYLVGRNNGNAWGTFKEGSAEASKLATNNKPAQNNNKPSQPVHNNTNTNVNSDWTKQNGVFVTGGEINLRTGASTNSSVIAQLPANTEVKYDAYRTEGQYTWLRQPRANGQYGYLVGRNNGNAWGTFKEGSAEVSKPATNNKPAQNNNKPSQPVHNNTNTNVNSDWTKQNGVFVTGGEINLRTGASTNSSVIAQLPANTEVKYDAYRTEGQYTWLRQPRANGQYGYLVGRNNGNAWGTFKEGSTEASKPANTNVNKPVQQNTQKQVATNNNATWTKQNGTFITGGAINLRTGASTKSPIIETLPINTVIKYDAYYRSGNYVWLRQPRANGQYGYLVGRLNNQVWGTYR
ncbi:lysozyme [Lactobacillus taiwanensis]|uniref:GH25 family lysozyme n=4 Tax=Lactobacillus taiwanensis TaxID=508451 RepID=UPI000B999C95|nr:GH25 family lysozyme [Lactobacillus taiwanensis]OYS04427.1 lysozyme [Lactobacillus taiwanensis]